MTDYNKFYINKTNINESNTLNKKIQEIINLELDKNNIKRIK